MEKSAGWEWINKMGTAWIDRDPQAIPPLFAENFKYYETPFSDPVTKIDQLISLWREVPDSQKDISFNFEMVSETQFRYIAHWQSSFTRIPSGKTVRLDGIFLINLNSQGLCTLFRQWWVSKENK